MLAQSQNLLVCETSVNADTSGLCPPGQSVVIKQAYVLTEDGNNFIGDLNGQLDYSQLAQGFAFGFTTVLSFYLVGKGIGMLLRVVR